MNDLQQRLQAAQRKDTFDLNDTELRLVYSARMYEVVEGLVNGGGDEKGIGTSLTASISMTAMTECYWGGSGRGNQNAKIRIRKVAAEGYLRIERKGKRERIFHTSQGLICYNELKALSEPLPQVYPYESE